MAITTTLSNNFKHLLMKKDIDFDTDIFRLILMTGEFAFDPDTHDNYTLVSGQEFAACGAYAKTGVELTGGALTRSNLTNKITMSWTNPSWTASGEAIGPIGGALIYDDSVTADPVVGHADFGEAITVSVGAVLQFQSIVVELT